MPITFHTEKFDPIEFEKTTREKLTPIEKFNRIKNKDKLRKFHFTVIENSDRLILFNGNGVQLMEAENSIKGERKLRSYAIELFPAVPDIHSQGGFLFNGIWGEN